VCHWEKGTGKRGQIYFFLKAENRKIDLSPFAPGQYFDAETGLHYNYFGNILGGSILVALVYYVIYVRGQGKGMEKG
jgi:hypothetical protein